MIHGMQDGTTSLREHLPARGAERIEQLLLIAIEGLHPRIGCKRRDDQRQSGRDRDLRDSPMPNTRMISGASASFGIDSRQMM